MADQLFAYTDWYNGNVIYSKKGYIINPFQDQEISSWSIDDIDFLDHEQVKFNAPDYKKIQKVQKSTHNNQVADAMNALTAVFSARFKKHANKYCFVKDEFYKMGKQFFHCGESDIPDNEIYSINIFGLNLTGHQIHEIRNALKERFTFCSQTYDHIYPEHGPLNKFNLDNVFVLSDAIRLFYHWLGDLHQLFEKNHHAICNAANFNPNNPGLQDYINIIEAYYTEGLYTTVQEAFEETYGYKNLNLDNTEINEFHIDFIAKRIRKLRMIINEQFRTTKKSRRPEFIGAIVFQLNHILVKAKNKLNFKGHKSAFNTDKTVLELLEVFVSEMELLNEQCVDRKNVVSSAKNKKATPAKKIVNSLMYNNWARDGQAINSLYQSMKEAGEIEVNTAYEDFKNAFSNKKVKNKIGITFEKGWAYHFFFKLKNSGKMAQHGYWNGVAQSFYLTTHKNYDMTDLAHQKSPRNKSLTARIETLINSI